MIRRPDVRWVLAELVASGRLADEAVPAAEDALVAHAAEGRESPGVIRALVGAGAWLAALLLAVFLAMFDLAEPPAGFVVGALAVGGGYALRRAAAVGSVFRSQVALSVSLAGHGLLWALLVNEYNEEAGSLVAGALMLWSLGFFPDPVHRFASAAGLVVVPLVVVGDVEGPWVAAWVGVLAAGLVAALMGEVAWQRSRWAELQLPVVFALAGGMAVLLAVLPVAGWVAWGLTAWLAVLLAGVMVETGRAVGATWASVGLGLGALVVVAAVAGSVPGVVGAALVVALGARRSHPVLLVGGVLGVIGFVARYYYMLEVSLLVKAGALLGAGVVLLVARMAARRTAR